ncbi:MAG: hypothetical protein OEY23_24060 [Acidimicrobiia bacterium]|nr:hypothetical protein [Acidimicrobiia bacterium]
MPAAGTRRDLDVVIMRGGTSKGVFVRLADLAPAGPERDAQLLAVMGSPDPMQLDGLGGTHSSTSKVVAVAPGADPTQAEVDYLFAQVGVDEPVVDYTGNCGNLTAAVGPYAYDEGLVRSAEVVLRNLNTGVRIRTSFAVAGDRFDPAGDTVIDGVPGSASAVQTDYLDPAGSVTGKLFPSGSRIDVVDGVEVSIIDVASPHAFVRAADVGIDGGETQAELNARPELLARLEALRRGCGAAIGVDSAAIPRLVLVSAPGGPGADVRIRATSMGKVHHAIPGTGALCTAAAVRLAGTVASVAGGAEVRIEHPKGYADARVHLDEAGGAVRSAGLVRTARRLLTGVVHW